MSVLDDLEALDLILATANEKVDNMSINVTEKLANKPTKRLRDYIAICLDESGSMSGHADRAWGVVRDQFENIGRLRDDPSRDTYLNYYTFNYNVTPHIVNTTGRCNVPERRTYMPGGSTAMLDAIQKAIRDLEPHDVSTLADNTSFLVVVVTDGAENSSRHCTWLQAKMLVEGKQRRDNWTFVFLTPNGTKHTLSRELGVPIGNIDEWDATAASEYERVSVATQGATVSYINQRAAGARNSTSFYTTDLSGLGKLAAAAKLDNVSGLYRRALVPREMDIQSFVTYSTGRTYVPGTAYYALTKPEEIQDGKSLLLVEKSSRSIFGGSRVREALSLPATGPVRVKPGNHGEWDIYVQSKSLNRKLVRGTSVLIEKAA